MLATNHKRTAAKFYQEDIVQRKDDPAVYGVVLRCWHDSEELESNIPDSVDPLLRPLKHGEVGVSYFPRPMREILSEDSLDLVDRMYQPGDLLKRSIDDVTAGVVVKVDVNGRLAHAITGQAIPEWRSMDEVESVLDVDSGDYVVCDGWVGQVIEMFDEATVDMGMGNLVRIPELSARLAVGERGADILPEPASDIQGIFGMILGSLRRSPTDTVVAVKRTVLAIAWLAINQTLDLKEAESRPRPQRYWYGSDLSKLTIVSRSAERALRVGDRVVLKDHGDAPVSSHGKEQTQGGTIEVRALVVQETRTRVDVLWQDGLRETLDARETVPYLNPDEYDCWPGDHVIWKTDDQKRHAVVQSVNAAERTAQVRLIDSGAIELASALELDPHGGSDWTSLAPNSDGIGVHRGEFVFIHSEDTTNGVSPPAVPRIGELEEWVRETPATTLIGQLSGWRKEMADIGTKIAERRGIDPALVEGQIKRAQSGDDSIDWFGEVIELQLDGTVEVLLPNGSVRVLPLERLTRLFDGLEQLDESWDDADSHSSFASDDNVEVWAMDEDGHWVEEDGVDEDDWESADEAEDTMSVDAEWHSDVPPPLMPEDIHIATEFEPPATEDVAPRSPSPQVERLTPTDVPRDATEAEEAVGSPVAEFDSSIWKRFEILPSAPVDHAFHSSPLAQPSRQFLARLNKEYRALTNSLPESILVRAYEDRTDLLRCLIIGPENTPYEDAPFVIDWMLDSNFPQSPPIAHFFSWTNGNGRVNPNLYEEGKVCLSILGTWAGDKNETWNPSRSSLLQAFVSIQGLVLVKEPWFCEPAYEKLRGTEDAIVNSRLYSEKAYVLSRGFVRRALEIPLGGLESEINWFYFTNGKLKKVLDDARALIEKSRNCIEDLEADKELAVPRLTGGGIIALERTLAKLQAILDSHSGQH